MPFKGLNQQQVKCLYQLLHQDQTRVSLKPLTLCEMLSVFYSVLEHCFVVQCQNSSISH